MKVNEINQYLYACAKGDLNFIKEKFKPFDHTQIELIKDTFEATCLHYAARKGQIDIMEYLIYDKQVSPNVTSSVGASLLHDATANGQLESIEWLIENTHLKIFTKDSNGATVFHIASKYGQHKILEWLLIENNKDFILQKTFYGTTCLHFACSFGSLECARLLLEHAPECIDYVTNTGLTALYLAIQENHLEIVLLLSDYGANFYHKTEDGMNLIHVASQNGSLDILKWLVQNKNFNLNDKDECGATAMHYAASNGHSKLVEYLLDQGADILVDSFCGTALHDCALNNKIECAKILLSYDFDVDQRDKNNLTALEVAQINGFTDLVHEIQAYSNRPKFNKEKHRVAKSWSEQAKELLSSASKSKQTTPTIVIVNSEDDHNLKPSNFKKFDQFNKTPIGHVFFKRSSNSDDYEQINDEAIVDINNNLKVERKRSYQHKRSNSMDKHSTTSYISGIAELDKCLEKYDDERYETADKVCNDEDCLDKSLIIEPTTTNRSQYKTPITPDEDLFSMLYSKVTKSGRPLLKSVSSSGNNNYYEAYDDSVDDSKIGFSRNGSRKCNYKSPDHDYSFNDWPEPPPSILIEDLSADPSTLPLADYRTFANHRNTDKSFQYLCDKSPIHSPMPQRQLLVKDLKSEMKHILKNNSFNFDNNNITSIHQSSSSTRSSARSSPLDINLKHTNTQPKNSTKYDSTFTSPTNKDSIDKSFILTPESDEASFFKNQMSAKTRYSDSPLNNSNSNSKPNWMIEFELKKKVSCALQRQSISKL